MTGLRDALDGGHAGRHTSGNSCSSLPRGPGTSPAAEDSYATAGMGGDTWPRSTARRSGAAG